MNRPLPLLILALCAAACGGAAEPARGPESDTTALVELTEPAMDRLDPAVRSQLTQGLARVRKLAAQSNVDGKALGHAYAELGRLYHTYELFDSAVPAYANAETLLPGEHPWPYYLGRVYQSLYEMQAARQALERARKLKPEDEPTLVASAQVHRELQEFDEAIRLLRAVLERNPESAAALLLMATLATDRGDPRAAVQWYERLLRLQPGATRLYQPLAMAYRNLGQTDRAKELLGKLGTTAVRIDDPLMLELEALGSGARRLLDEGVAAFQRGDFEAAVSAFRGAVTAQPDNVGAHLNLGSALVEAGRLDEAVEEYRVVIRLDPTHAMGHFNLGTLFARRGDDANAFLHYEESLRVDPGSRNTRFNLANLLRRTGRCGEALPHYAELLQMDPRLGPARAAHALCQIQLGRYDEALQHLEQSLEVLPTDPSLIQILARLLAACPRQEIRDGARALRMAEALVAARRSVPTLETLAMAQAENARFDAAVRTQTEALAAVERGTTQAERMSRNLELYEQGQPCRDPQSIVP